MGRTQTPPSRSTWALGITLFVGIGLVIHGLSGETAPQPSAAQAYASPAAGEPGPKRPAPVAKAPKGPPGSRPRSVPVRLRIPAIRVDAPMMNLALNKSGALEVPPADKAGFAGWYSKGPAPGESGAAIVAGHVDTPTGRAVFFRLGALTKGSAIEITRLDGRTAFFTVDAVEVYAKRTFPNQKVYGNAAAPQLRIITCGGGYRKKAGYLGNVVVYATLKRTS